MENILSGFLKLNDVTGVCIVDDGELEYRLFEEDYDLACLEKTISFVCRIKEIIRKDYSDFKEFTTSYKKAVVIVRRIFEEKLLVVFSSPECDVEKQSFAIDDVESALHRFDQGLSEDLSVELEDVIKWPEYDESAGQVILSAIIKVMGPIGEVIFTDAKKRWEEQREGAEMSTRELIQIVKAEIGDDELIGEFEKKMEIHSLGT